MIQGKGKLGFIFSVLSIFPVLLSIATHYSLRGPNADIYFIIKMYTTLSIIGLFLVICSFLIAKPKMKSFLSLINVISIVLNTGVLSVAFLLLLAMGISER